MTDHSRQDLSHDSVVLVHEKEPAIRPGAEAHVDANGGLQAQCDRFLRDHLEQRLDVVAVAQLHSAYRILTAIGQVVRGKVKDLALGEISEEHPVLQLGDRLVSVHEYASRRRLGLEERIELAMSLLYQGQFGCSDIPPVGATPYPMPSCHSEVPSESRFSVFARGARAAVTFRYHQTRRERCLRNALNNRDFSGAHDRPS